MRLSELPRTSGFRLAMVFLALFGAASTLLFVFLHMQTQRFLIAHVDDWLRRETPDAFALPAGEVARRFDARTVRQRATGNVFVVLDPQGRRIAGNDVPLPARFTVFDTPFDFSLPSGRDRDQYRGIAHRLPEGEIVLVAQNMYDTGEFNEEFVKTALRGAALTATLGLLGALIVGITTMRRFDAVTAAIERIMSGDLSRRLPSRGMSGDLGRLAHVVNTMLDEIERLMDEVKGVCDGIAHDLRTPLTRMLAGLERARRRATSTEAYAGAVDDAIAELRGILQTFSALLRIAEVEDGARRAGFSSVSLGDIARDVVDFYDPLAEEKGIALTLRREAADPIDVDGDASLLFEALGNLVENAIKFTPANGEVVVEIRRADGKAMIRVIDTGPGIGASEREAVLRRFYRSEKSRHTDGNGLGLSLVAAVARLHRMELVINDSAPGCVITLTAFPESQRDGGTRRVGGGAPSVGAPAKKG